MGNVFFKLSEVQETIGKYINLKKCLHFKGKSTATIYRMRYNVYIWHYANIQNTWDPTKSQ